MTRKLLVFATVMMLALPFAAAAADAPQPQYGKEIGQALKPFDLKQVEGPNVTLESLAGKNTVLIFMQSSCTQCRDEMKTVNAMYEQIKGKVNVAAIGVDIDPARLTQYKGAYKIQFPILLDPEFTVPTSVGVRVTPATIVIDKEGKIAQKILGGIGASEIEELFSKL